jgi:hypothetical protein
MDEANAKAVQAGGTAIAETAKLGGKVVDAGTGFAGWLKNTFGTIPQDLLGIAGGDWLHQQRRRNLLALEMRTETIRALIGAGTAHEPSVSVVLPLLQAAADEARPELQELWAALLASALQPDGGRRVRRAFFDTLRQMEPADAALLDAIASKTEWRTGDYIQAYELVEHLDISPTEADVAEQALKRMGLVRDGNKRLALTSLGKAFWTACHPGLNEAVG